MSNSYKLAVVGNGTTAINALHALVEEYRESALVLPPLNIKLFGDTPEEECGKGFAYGRIGGSVGHLTESPDHADYGSAKGEFRRYVAATLSQPADTIRRATRKLVGGFHAKRYAQVQNDGEETGIGIGYREARVNDLSRDDDGRYGVIFSGGREDGFDRVVLAVGDVLSTQFDDAARQNPGKVFRTPYDAIATILRHSDADTVTVARGTRSSFVDLVNPLRENGYQGRIIGVSPSGSTSWQTQEDAGPYIPKVLTDGRHFTTAVEVVGALRDELTLAHKSGAYIPPALLRLDPVKIGARVGWDFDLKAEAANADRLTYHQVVHAVKWEGIYENLRDGNERRAFTATLGDFIIYNRVNIIVADDYKQFVAGIESGRVEIRRSGFDAADIRPDVERHRLTISLGTGALNADYAVNCSIGPAPAAEQAKTHDLLRALSDPRRSSGPWLTPREGTGFDLAPGHAIDLLGSQKRPYVFSGIGLETYGRQSLAWASDFVSELSTRAAIQSPQPSTPRSYDHV